ncbi:hypothetical protein Tco_1205697, partial [Tanacetum coccineum]
METYSPLSFPAKLKEEDVFRVNDLKGDEVIVETEVDHEVVVETEVSSKDVNLSVDEVTLAQPLAALKSAKPKAEKVMLQEPEQGTITTTTTVKVQDKGKGIMVEEPLNMKKKCQISFDEQEAIRLQVEFDEEERLGREKDEANIALTEEWNDIQAKIDVDYQLQRRKHFAAMRAEEKRNRPPTRAQQRSIIFQITFVDYKTELMEESSKKAEVMEEMEEDKESEELKQCLEIIPDDGDDVTIDATPLSTKYPTIVDYKIYKEGKKSYFQIIKADRSRLRVYYVEGLGHNLFSVGQFCDSDLKVAFRKHTCFIRDLDGVDLIKGSR